MERPVTIHDFGGFPRKLYERQYPASGSPSLAAKICERVSGTTLDQEWGLDHGAWSVLAHMYPDADIPVVQLSIDRNRPMSYHYALGQTLRPFRREGVMIIGSGNAIHNLWMVRPDENGFNNRLAYDWAGRINEKIKKAVLEGDHESLVDYEALDPDMELAVPSREHYIPLLYVLGAMESGERAELFNDEIVAGSLSMTSLQAGSPEY